MTFGLTGKAQNVEMPRLDPEFDIIHESTPTWEAGKKWWSEAKIALADAEIISGKPPPMNLLFRLPFYY